MKMNHRLGLLGAAAMLALAGHAARADVLLSVDFEDFNAFGWTANGNAEIDQGRGYPGNCLLLPYDSFQAISLSARGPESMVLGDLTKVGPMRVSADIQIFQAHTFFNDPLDMAQWPMVFEVIDHGDPDNGVPFASVYVIQGHWPATLNGWDTFSFEIPDPSSETLPPGWGGTGDTDPNTDEPILPRGVTYRSIMSSVDEVRITTYVPGFLYGSNFWEVGFDNILVESSGSDCAADFNDDGEANSQDFFDFLTAFFAGEERADFNADGIVNSQDFFDFLGAFFTGC